MITKDNLYSYVGKKFNRLIVLSICAPKKRSDGRNHNMVKCMCDCGNVKEYKLTEVKTGHSKSCGCLRIDNYRAKVTTHGLSYHPLFQVYEGMIKRCYDHKDCAYHNYGGRGITVCDEWKNDKIIFFNWALENGWRKGLEIDRYPNNDGNYEPINCRFATKKMNMRNTRRNKLHFYDNESKTLIEWSEVLGFDYALVNKRLWRGWTFEKAVETPNPNIPSPGEQLVMLAEYKETDLITLVTEG